MFEPYTPIRVFVEDVYGSKHTLRELIQRARNEGYKLTGEFRPVLYEDTYLHNSLEYSSPVRVRTNTPFTKPYLILEKKKTQPRRLTISVKTLVAVSGAS